MALSDDERRVLEEMERHLRSSTNDVVDLAPTRRVNPTSVTVGVLLVVAGISVLLAAVMFHVPVVGVLGFGAMVVGVLVALRRTGGEPRPNPRGNRPSAPKQSTFEQRWERRMGGDL